MDLFTAAVARHGAGASGSSPYAALWPSDASSSSLRVCSVVTAGAGDPVIGTSNESKSGHNDADVHSGSSDCISTVFAASAAVACEAAHSGAVADSLASGHPGADAT